MQKKLKLRPSQRENRRYLLIETSKKEDVKKAILDYIGLLGWAKATPFFVKEKILTVNRKEIDKVKAALVLAGIKVIKVSGTLKGLEN
jgi:RNase P/RNase MRP subunit POP5